MVDRRLFLRASAGAISTGGLFRSVLNGSEFATDGVENNTVENGPMTYQTSAVPPSYSLIPVVGDGKWIWTKPPDEKTGYLEPRDYRLQIGIEMIGTGTATNLKATTPVPIACPEQTIDDVSVDTVGCGARFRKLSDYAADLFLTAPRIVAGGVVRATAEFQLTLTKQYQGFKPEQFPQDQPVKRNVHRKYMQNSPGIQTSDTSVRRLAGEVSSGVKHPWDKAQAFQRWVLKNISGRPGNFTSVTRALQSRVGDCEEKAAVFVALCRVSEIPARLVWVPNHNWAEFFLVDNYGKGKWIPAHTSCYSWFGWTGAHELVIQKGDRIKIPGKRGLTRLQSDWAQWSGRRPNIRWFAKLEPVAKDSQDDPGPGGRYKAKNGEWLLLGRHKLDPKMRDGQRLAELKAEAKKRAKKKTLPARSASK